MIDFKEFLDAVAKGEHRRDLFLLPNKELRESAILTLFNVASNRGMCPIIRRTDSTVILDQSLAMVRIAHPYIDRELKSIVWTGLHGLDTLDDFEHADDMKTNLQAMVR